MYPIRLLILIIFFFTFTGCAVTLPQKTSYTLNPGPVTLAQKHPSSKTLLVMNTESNDELDTKKIAYVIRPYQLAYFARNTWVTEPADQINALITHALQQSHYFKAVVATPFAGVTDLKLTTHLYKLQQSFLFNPSRIQLVLAAQLVNSSTGKIIAAKTFSYSVATKSNTPYAGVAAANSAVRQLLRDLVRFVVRGY